jgi:hypothetical protein
MFIISQTATGRSAMNDQCFSASTAIGEFRKCISTIAAACCATGRRGVTWTISGLGCVLAVCVACPAQAGALAAIQGVVEERFIGGGSQFATFDRSVIGSASDAVRGGFSIPGLRRLDGNAFAAAGNGGVHAMANTSYSDEFPQDTFDFRAFSSAMLTMDDFIISGAPGTLITTRLNLHLTGTEEAGSTLFTNSALTGSASGLATEFVFITVAGKNVGTGEHNLTSTNGGPATAVGLGLLANFTGNNVLTTNLFTVAANTPFSVALDLVAQGDSILSGNGAGFTTSLSDFSNTLTFVEGAPVFDLPAGYTASSLEAGIVNNRFTPADGAAVVPEPSSIILWGIGGLFLTIGSLRRRRRAREI